jgi:hypothetical protein
MLTTGIEVLGIFVYCYDINEKNQNFKKLNHLMCNLFSQD